jgi:plastocyanin
MSFRGGRLALLVLTAALVWSGCGGDRDTETEAGTTITVSAFMFDPDPLVVETGAIVTWTNRDATVHTVTSRRRGTRGDPFDGKLAPTGGRFSRAFDRPGTYRYFCSRHSGPGMAATVVVEASSG